MIMHTIMNTTITVILWLNWYFASDFSSFTLSRHWFIAFLVWNMVIVINFQLKIILIKISKLKWKMVGYRFG